MISIYDHLEERKMLKAFKAIFYSLFFIVTFHSFANDNFDGLSLFVDTEKSSAFKKKEFLKIIEKKNLELEYFIEFEDSVSLGVQSQNWQTQDSTSDYIKARDHAIQTCQQLRELVEGLYCELNYPLASEREASICTRGTLERVEREELEHDGICLECSSVPSLFFEGDAVENLADRAARALIRDECIICPEEINNFVRIRPPARNELRRRPLLPNLSPFWAQQQTGSDLALDFIRDLDQQMIASHRPVIISESSVDVPEGRVPDSQISHGGHVQGVFEQSSSQSDSLWVRNNAQGLANIRSSLSRSRSQRVINFSHTLSDVTAQTVNRMLADDHVIVTSAGNYYPFGVSRQKAELKDSGAIIVGSTHPFGGPSRFSSHGHVTISAPSDNYLGYTDRQNGIARSMGGTSGAAPQVSAAINNAQTILDYHLDSESAKHLLKMSASPSVDSLLHGSRSQNGVGTLNSFKMVKVANRIRSECESLLRNRLSSTLMGRCIRQKVQDPLMYQFTPASDDFLQQVRSNIPGCDPKNYPPRSLLKAPRCQETSDTLFKQLRQHVLLNPTPELLRCLAGSYYQMGFDGDAQYYANLANAFAGDNSLASYMDSSEWGTLPFDSRINIFVSAYRSGGVQFNRETFERYFPLESERSALLRLSTTRGGIGVFGQDGLAVLQEYARDGEGTLKVNAIRGLTHLSSLNIFHGVDELSSGAPAYNSAYMDEDIRNASSLALNQVMELARTSNDPEVLLGIARSIASHPLGVYLAEHLYNHQVEGRELDDQIVNTLRCQLLADQIDASDGLNQGNCHPLYLIYSGQNRLHLQQQIGVQRRDTLIEQMGGLGD